MPPYFIGESSVLCKVTYLHVCFSFNCRCETKSIISVAIYSFEEERLKTLVKSAVASFKALKK